MTPEERRLSWLCKTVRVALKLVTRIEVRGADLVTEAHPAVFGANHRSLADLWVGLSVFSTIEVYPGILFSKKMLPGPLSRIAEAMGVILVSSGGATEAAITALNSGRSIMVMPEGHLHFDPASPRQLAPIRPGIARMARASNLPLVPIAVDGTEHVWPPGKWPRFNPLSRRTIVVTFGAPQAVTECQTDQEAADTVMAAVSAALTP